MFWERFYLLCQEIGKKPNPVGKEIGVSSGAITKWKNGTIPPADTLMSIASFFDVSVDYLLGNTDEKNPPGKRKGDTVQVHIMDFHGKEPEVITIPREKYEKMQRLLRAYEAEEEREKKHDPGIF